MTLFLRCFLAPIISNISRMLRGLFMHLPFGSPASVDCFAVEGQRLQKSSSWCPEMGRSVDLEDAGILFFVAC